MKHAMAIAAALAVLAPGPALAGWDFKNFWDSTKETFSEKDCWTRMITFGRVSGKCKND